ncbi:MAG: amidohydrolase family protein [Pirellulaceae bacterium]
MPSSHQHLVHGTKLFTDGAIGSRTAAIEKEYRGGGGNGLLLYADEALSNELRKCFDFAKPVAVHAIGNRAIEQTIRILERDFANVANSVRMEHLQFVSRDLAARAQKLGVQFCMQPNFSDDSRHYADRLPIGYPEANNPFRMLIDEAGFQTGVELLLGSDGMPHGVVEAVRQSLFPVHDGQRLSMDELIAGYCMSNLEMGSIELTIDETGKSVSAQVRPATVSAD